MFNNYEGVYNWSIFFNNHTGQIISEKNGDFLTANKIFLFQVVFKPFDQIISINGSDFDDSFYLTQFHFHWGFNDYQGTLIH